MSRPLLKDSALEVIIISLQIDGRLTELNAYLMAEGDTRGEALARAEKATPHPDWYSGSGLLPMPK